MKYLLLLLSLSIFPILGISQQTLNLEDAISIALKNNYDILLAENSVMQADNNQSIYNSRYLPTLTGTGNATYANNNAKLTNQAGAQTEISGIEATQLNGSVALNYVLFNGGSRKYNFDRLKNQYELSSATKKIQIENTLIDVYTTFFNVARNQEQKNTLIEAYDISKERLDRVIAQQKYGQKTSLDVLNAKVDANADSITLLSLTVQLENNIRNLNFLLGRDISTLFEVSNEVVLEENLTYEGLLEQLKSDNNQLKQIAINQAISEQTLKINQAGWLPSVTSSVGYGINYSDNGPAGFFAIQQSNGFNAGLSLSWNIFDGGATKVNVQNAQIAIQNQELNAKKLSLNLENQLASFWAEYNTQKVIN
jgi:outer membrane protein